MGRERREEIRYPFGGGREGKGTVEDRISEYVASFARCIRARDLSRSALTNDTVTDTVAISETN